jgi:hypothetical protein
MNPIQAYPAEGVVVQGAHHGHYAPEAVDNKTGAGTYVTSENESHNSAPGNVILARDAQTKGRWFQYLKTKQFWITLVLGQGTLPSISVEWTSCKLTRYYSPRSLYHRHEHIIVSAR